MRLHGLLGGIPRRVLRYFFPKKWFALDGMDKKLRRHLRHREGFFVELGAYDGVRQSNTLHFERWMGWRGILIEPIPWRYEECKLNRTNSIVLNYACVSAGSPGDRIEMVACGPMSVVRGTRRRAGQDAEDVIAAAQSLSAEPQRVSVPTATLGSLLDECGSPHVDLLSLDVEGYELQVLKGLDINRHRPDFILTEMNHREEIEQYVEPWYKLVEQLTVRDALFQVRRP